MEDLEFALKRADIYFNGISKAHYDCVECEGTSEEKQKLDEEYETVQDMYQTRVVSLESKIMEMKRKLNEERARDNEEKAMETSMSVPYYSNNVRLPKLDIPKFRGEYEKWPEFRELFASLIHDKNNIPDVQKLHYLEMNLEGKAANVIKHLQINGAHYEAAWDTLNKRYNNKKMLVNTNLKRLFSQRYVNNENAEELKELLDTSKEILCTLESLGEKTSHWNSIIVFIISQRLPPETTALWECQRRSNSVFR